MSETPLLESLRVENFEHSFADDVRVYTLQDIIAMLLEALEAKTEREFRVAIAYAHHQMTRLYDELEAEPLTMVRERIRHAEFKG